MSDDWSDRQRDARSRVRTATGDWREGHAAWLRTDTDAFERFAAFAAHVWSRDALDDRTKALVAVALNASATHLYADGLRAAVDLALDAGATPDEVHDAMLLTCGVGMHSVIEGLPVVLDATADADGRGSGSDGARREAAGGGGESAGGTPDPRGGPDAAAARERVRRSFEERRGYWSAFWESVLAADHDYLDRYTDLSAAPGERGTIDPKLRELLFVAIDASTTHLYGPGLETHVENAVAEGATRAELVSVLELASLQGYDTMLAGTPILRDAVAARTDEE